MATTSTASTATPMPSAVLAAVGTELQTALAKAWSAPERDHVALVHAAWQVVARPKVDRVFALFFEAAGLAAAGHEPYRTLAPVLVDAWVEWLMENLTGTRARRRAEAEATLAMLDGLPLLRQLSGPAAASRAAERLGVR